ncbi:hypothetical protein PHYPSEUDO_003777 [Phytophthora pseudosyringae]|uniref:Uncharacterized protein n=1 Tax=Phytophthora pseudosyringae TaxID=221518 RepID=A0A8T1WCA1_9STRA|nr:hypothetical protein PHYPSEUDO_003777 [Phytophthora pseudosyringae]
MQLPRVRAMRPNAAVHDFATKRVDASIGLNKSGLFSLTLGALTSGCSKDGTLELMDIARKVGIKEESKEFWEGFQLAICGLASDDFRACFDEVKQRLRDSGFPMETISMVFCHAIIGLPKSKELLLPIRDRLKDALFDVVFGVNNGGRLASDSYEFMLFESEDEVWNVYSAFSDELQWERAETYSTPQLRAQLSCELDVLVTQAKVQAGQVTLQGEPDKEKPPPHPISTSGKKRCHEEEEASCKATKSPKLDGQVAVRLVQFTASKPR